ncbi:MAG TPA: hypothetical protein VJK02_15675 [Anaerolineales bacterium]|nr:hypothetical protein [Anaerolineales bacterium]
MTVREPNATEIPAATIAIAPYIVLFLQRRWSPASVESGVKLIYLAGGIPSGGMFRVAGDPTTAGCRMLVWV